MAQPNPLNLAPLQTPPIVVTAGFAGLQEFRWTDPWLKYFAFLNSFFNGGGGGGGGSGGGGFMSGQNVTTPGQVISLPFAVPAVGSRGILRLTQDAGGGNLISWDPAQFGPENTGINLNANGITLYDLYVDDRGTGPLWYLANPPYLLYL